MALSKTDVSALYVAIFNRASEAEGNTFWQTQGTTAEVATAMLDTAPAKAYFGAALDDDQAFVEHIYQNTLGKTPAEDADGIAYWAGELATQSRGEVVARLIESAKDPANAGAAQDLFLNMVAVSDYTADTLENAPSNLDSVRFDKGLAGVTADKATVEAAKETVNNIAKIADTGPLSQALSDYQDAVAAERAFLEAVVAQDSFQKAVADAAAAAAAAGVTGPVAVNKTNTNDEIIAVIDALVNGASGKVASELVSSANPTISAYSGVFASASATVKAEIIAEAKTAAAKQVSDTQAEVAKISGQVAKVNAYVNAKASEATAQQSAADALVAVNAELAKFDSLNGATTPTATAVYTPAIGTASVTYVVSDGTSDIIVLQNGRLVVTADGKATKGIDALLNAARDDYQAQLARDAAVDALQKRLDSVLEGEDISTPGVEADLATTDSDKLIKARTAEAELVEAINGYETIAGVKANQVARDKAVVDAEKAIEKLGYELGDLAGTDADDLFVLAGKDLTISGFGLEGHDLLFIGEGFAEVSIAAGGNAVEDRVGNASELEIFFQQDGNNALIYVEQKAFAGNAANGEDLVQITLQGVNIDDLQYENGFLAIA